MNDKARVDNAIKFTPRGGRIEIEVRVQASWIHLTVADTGIGIGRDKLVDIYDAFSRVNGSSHRHYKGLGLGLTLVKAVVKAHGGQIMVKSQPASGSQFTIMLPVLSSTAEDKPIKKFPSQKRILIVDDEENVASMLQTGLEQLTNCEIVRATGGQQALRLFKRRSFDLLITDYNMPGMDGLSLAAQIRRLYPQTIVIMLTGYANDKLRQQATHVSITHILDKPVRLKEIRRVALELLGQEK